MCDYGKLGTNSYTNTGVMEFYETFTKFLLGPPPIGKNSTDKEEIAQNSTSIIQNNQLNNNSNHENNTECCICLEIIIEKYVLIPCGHVGTCQTCVADLKINQCPLCRQNFCSYIQIFE
jgi:hypothetical protein